MTSVWIEASTHLLKRYGRAAKPCGDSPLERAITSVARSKNAGNAAKLVQSLRDADLLDLPALAQVGIEELSEVLPKGTAAGTTRRVRDFAKLIVNEFAGSLEQLFARDVDEQQSALRTVNGLGPETIDTILLAAGELPVLPVTAALHRIAKRHGWIDQDLDSESIAAEIGTATFENFDACWQLHAQLERVGKDYCGSTPLCGDCPLVTLLPESGPLKPEL